MSQKEAHTLADSLIIQRLKHSDYFLHEIISSRFKVIIILIR